MMRIHFNGINNENSNLQLREIDNILNINNSISDIIKSLKWYLSLKIFKKVKFEAPFKKLVVEDNGEKRIYTFNSVKKVPFYVTNNHYYLEDKNLGILASISREDFKKDPDNTFQDLINQFVEYYDFLYKEYVENIHNDKLSKGAVTLAKKIKSEIKDVSIKS